VIGRDQPADILISKPQVSATHARARNISPGLIEIEDLNSSNGTFINGVRIEFPTRAHPGDQVDLGSYQLHPPLLGGLFYTTAPTDKNSFPGSTQIQNEIQQPTDSSDNQIYIPSVSPSIQGDYNSQGQCNQNDGWMDPSQKQQQQPLPPVPVANQQLPVPGYAQNQISNATVQAIHETKSYVGSALITWILYYFGFYIVGLVLNFIYLSQAKETQKITGRNPSGYGCLIILLVFHLIIPVVGLIFLFLFGSAIFASLLSFS